MAKFTGELSGSLAFIESGVVQTQMIPGIESLNLTGSLNISGSQLTVNGRNVFGEIDALTAGADPDIGTLRIHSQSMLEYTSSTDIRLSGIEAYTGSVDQLNAATSSYFLQTDAANVVSSSNQIVALGFGRDNVVSGSDQILDLGFKKDVISGSQQMLDLGFVTSSNIASYNDLTDVPSGIVSSSVQVADLGFISGSEYYELGSIPEGIVSSSNQVETLLSNNSVDFGTGVVSASFFSGDGSGLRNLNIGQVSSIRETFTATGSITIDHNFSSYNVNVAVYDSSNTLILPASIQLTSDNSAKIEFDSLTAGHAVVSLGGHIFTGSTAWSQVTEKPTGIISSSAQITALGRFLLYDRLISDEELQFDSYKEKEKLALLFDSRLPFFDQGYWLWLRVIYNLVLSMLWVQLLPNASRVTLQYLLIAQNQGALYSTIAPYRNRLLKE